MISSPARRKQINQKGALQFSTSVAFHLMSCHVWCFCVVSAFIRIAYSYIRNLSVLHKYHINLNLNICAETLPYAIFCDFQSPNDREDLMPFLL